ncbi:translation initiation factor IF-2 [Streptomyces pactum]|uniref:translation initiation factor IF-2 n=1 Tax=Streptomyces pactum TaxID=68249 RepID=UPI0036FD0E45
MSDGKKSGPGGGDKTPWESMSYEQMLAWLEAASPATVRATADRLATAAAEIEKIGEELKIRPQYVAWKGEGADAFRLWGNDLANATLRLGDFGKQSARWLAEAADIITDVKAAFPRYTSAGEAQRNLDAAHAAPNDPDADTVAQKSSAELTAMKAEKEKADKERARQEAAQQMRRLATAYAWSTSHLNELHRPKFPPPPTKLQPTGYSQDFEVVSYGSGVPATHGPGTGDGPATEQHRPPIAAATGATGQSPAPSLPEVPGPGASVPVPVPGPGADVRPHPLPSMPDPVGMEIDGTAPPKPIPLPDGSPVDLPTGNRPDVGLPRPSDMIPPVVGGLPPTRPGRTVPGGRPSVLPGPGLPQSGTGRLPDGGTGPVMPGGQPAARDTGRSSTGSRPPMPPGTGPMNSSAGAAPRNHGIVGGRPVPPPTGRSVGPPPGTVIGGERARPYGRGPIGMAPGPGIGEPVPQRRTGASERRLPNPNSGIVGGRPRQAKPPGHQPFTEGGSGLARQDTQDDQSEQPDEGREAVRRNAHRAEPPAGD